MRKGESLRRERLAPAEEEADERRLVDLKTFTLRVRRKRRVERVLERDRARALEIATRGDPFKGPLSTVQISECARSIRRPSEKSLFSRAHDTAQRQLRKVRAQTLSRTQRRRRLLLVPAAYSQSKRVGRISRRKRRLPRAKSRRKGPRPQVDSSERDLTPGEPRRLRPLFSSGTRRASTRGRVARRRRPRPPATCRSGRSPPRTRRAASCPKTPPPAEKLNIPHHQILLSRYSARTLCVQLESGADTPKGSLSSSSASFVAREEEENARQVRNQARPARDAADSRAPASASAWSTRRSTATSAARRRPRASGAPPQRSRRPRPAPASAARAHHLRVLIRHFFFKELRRCRASARFDSSQTYARGRVAFQEHSRSSKLEEI